MSTNKEKIRATPRCSGEGSFTLIETVIALAIVAFLIVEVAVVQGNAIVFAEYGKNVSQATWLARRVMSQVDYLWHTKPFKELMTHGNEQKFEDFPDFSYSIEIAEWKFPFVKLLQTALSGDGRPGKKKDDSDEFAGREKKVDTGGTSDMVEQVVKQIFGDEPIFLTAKVEVSWPEGAQRNSTSLTYLMTNQAKLDEAITGMKSVYDRLTKPPPKPGAPAGTLPAGGAAPAPGANGIQPPNPPDASGQGGNDGSQNQGN